MGVGVCGVDESVGGIETIGEHIAVEEFIIQVVGRNIQLNCYDAV